MVEKKWVLLSIPSGLRIEPTIKKFVETVGGNLETGDDFWRVTKKYSRTDTTAIEFRSVQNHLEVQSETNDSLSEVLSDTRITEAIETPSMKKIFWYLPWESSTKLLQIATKHCMHALKRFSNEEDPQINTRVMVLIAHLAFFSGRNNEFRIRSRVFEKLSANQSSANQFSLFITLIDDVYDMFFHLTREGGVFSEPPKKEEKISNKTKFLDQCRKVFVLNDILEWRQAEIMATEDFASQNNGKFIAFGVKQPSKTLLGILTGKDTKTIYLSHPITEVRKEAKEKGLNLKKLEIVKEINSIPNKISSKSNHQFVVLIPTAIDELRFETTIENTPGGKENLLSGKLAERWPFAKLEEHLLYTPPGSYNKYKEKEVKKILRIDYDGKEKTVQYWKGCSSTLIETLAQRIKKQISSRDRLLVSNADNIIVYRPLYRRKEGYSLGTKNELIQWIYRVNLDFRNNPELKKNHAAIVHVSEDLVGSLLKVKEDDDSTGIFSRGNIPLDEVKKRKKQLKKEQFLKILLPSAKIEDLKSLISNHIIGIWIMKSADELDIILLDIIKFLKGDEIGFSTKSQWWENSITDFSL